MADNPRGLSPPAKRGFDMDPLAAFWDAFARAAGYADPVMQAAGQAQGQPNIPPQEALQPMGGEALPNVREQREQGPGMGPPERDLLLGAPNVVASPPPPFVGGGAPNVVEEPPMPTEGTWLFPKIEGPRNIGAPYVPRATRQREIVAGQPETVTAPMEPTGGVGRNPYDTQQGTIVRVPEGQPKLEDYPPTAGTSTRPAMRQRFQSQRGILDLIGQAEGTDKGRGYNETLGYGAFTGGPVNLTGMTIDQVLGLQRQMLAHPNNTFNSSAVGRYQIVGQTLGGLKRKLGLSGNELFDGPMQDRLASELVKQRGPNPAALRNEWAGLRGVSDETIRASFNAPGTRGPEAIDKRPPSQAVGPMPKTQEVPDTRPASQRVGPPPTPPEIAPTAAPPLPTVDTTGPTAPAAGVASVGKALVDALEGLAAPSGGGAMPRAPAPGSPPGARPIESQLLELLMAGVKPRSGLPALSEEIGGRRRG